MICHGRDVITTHGTSLFLEKFLVTPDAAGYHFINQGSLTVDNVDDREEIQITDVRCCLGPGAVADLHSKILEARPQGSKFFQFHAVFGKIWQNCMLVPPPGSWRPLLGEILDPPLGC